MRTDLCTFLFIFFLLFFSMSQGKVYAADVISPSNNHTASEEIEGKEVWEKLQVKQLECKNLTEEFKKLGGQLFACGTCLEIRHKGENKACPVSTMKDLVKMIEE